MNPRPSGYEPDELTRLLHPASGFGGADCTFRWWSLSKPGLPVGARHICEIGWAERWVLGVTAECCQCILLSA